MPYKKIITFIKKYRRNSNGDGYQESTQLWVADFGNSEIEEELRKELKKIKPYGIKTVSWIFTSLLLLLTIVLSELLIRSISQNMFWSETALFYIIWIWRLVLLIIWLYISRLKMNLTYENIFVIAITSFSLGVIISSILKIVYIGSIWTWLNLLIEPIWMILIIALIGSIFVKYIFKNN